MQEKKESSGFMEGGLGEFEGVVCGTCVDGILPLRFRAKRAH